MYKAIRDSLITAGCLGTLIGQLFLARDVLALSYQISALETQGCVKTETADKRLDIFLKALQGGEGL